MFKVMVGGASTSVLEDNLLLAIFTQNESILVLSQVEMACEISSPSPYY